MSPLCILLFLFFTVVPLWRYYRGVFPVAMPLHVVTRISSLDRTISKGRSTYSLEINIYFSHC